MLQQSTLMGLDPNTTNSSRYVIVHDSHIVMLTGRVTCYIWPRLARASPDLVLRRNCTRVEGSQRSTKST